MLTVIGLAGSAFDAQGELVDAAARKNLARFVQGCVANVKERKTPS